MKRFSTAENIREERVRETHSWSSVKGMQIAFSKISEGLTSSARSSFSLPLSPCLISRCHYWPSCVPLVSAEIPSALSPVNPWVEGRKGLGDSSGISSGKLCLIFVSPNADILGSCLESVWSIVDSLDDIPVPVLKPYCVSVDRLDFWSLSR